MGPVPDVLGQRQILEIVAAGNGEGDLLVPRPAPAASGSASPTSMTAVAVRLTAVRPGLREALLFMGALLAYQASRALVIGDASTATSHAWDVLRLERDLGLDVEGAIRTGP